jgi:hypothetical protein
MAGGTHRSLKDEATTAWSVGLDAARWRAACATGNLLAAEGHEGDGGPAMHFTLMIARMLKTREEDDATSSPILASRSVGPTYVSCAAVMTLGGNDPRPTIVFTTPGNVSFATLGEEDPSRAWTSAPTTFLLPSFRLVPTIVRLCAATVPSSALLTSSFPSRRDC